MKVLTTAFYAQSLMVTFNTKEVSKLSIKVTNLTYDVLNEALNLLLLHSIKKKFLVIEPSGVQ